MKKILLLFVALATMASCSKDDPAPTVDPIVGKWIHASNKIEAPAGGPVYNSAAGICSSLEPITYAENLSGNWVSYNENEGICTYLGTIGFTWENQGQGKYLQKEPMDNVLMTVSFTDKNTVMKTVNMDGDYTITNVYTRQ